MGPHRTTAARRVNCQFAAAGLDSPVVERSAGRTQRAVAAVALRARRVRAAGAGLVVGNPRWCMPVSVQPAEIERLTQKLGREIFDRVRSLRPSPLRAEWWEQRMLDQCMGNERFKVQAFRFIDALPTLAGTRDVARHLREYFHERGNADAPRGSGFVRMLAGALNFSHDNSLWATTLANAARSAALKMARRFIAGSNVDEAVRTIQRLREQNLAFTIDVLGESALSPRECEHYQNIYAQLLDELPRRAAAWRQAPQIDQADGSPLPRVNVSVKVTALYAGFDPIAADRAKARAKELLRPLLRSAMRSGSHLHVDMEHYAVKDLTQELTCELFSEPEFRDYPHFGVVLQAYLRDADHDAQALIDWARQRGAPIWVRLVKGAYWDSETVWSAQRHWPCPVWRQKWQSDACYERVTRLLLAAHRHVRTAFASHNVRSLAHAIALRRTCEIPTQAFELQMLYGMGDPIKRAVADLGERCRVYTPYGQVLPGMAYLIRRLLENTSNESFLAHAAGADTPVDDLLRAPEETGRDTAPAAPPANDRYEFEERVMQPFENSPDTDFALPAARQRMDAALAAVRRQLGREIPMQIGGRAVTTGAWVQSHNPARPAELIARVARADEATIDAAVRAAAEAQRRWRRTAPDERAALLGRVAEYLEEKRFELAAWQALECSKPWREADADVSEAVDFCRYYASEMIRISRHARRRDIPGEANEYAYQPRGVVAVLSVWSFPLALLAGATAAAVVTGNAVVMKPAGAAGAVAASLMDAFAAAGAPPGVVNFVAGPGEAVGEPLVRHPRVAMVSFTGSVDAGRRVYELAASAPTDPPGFRKVLLDLGGKNALIVDSDADLDEAIKGVLVGAFAYAGQKCTATSRVIVLDAIHDRLVERLVDAAGSLSLGPAESPTTSVPPLIDARSAEAVRQFIASGKREARCVLEVDAGRLIEESGGHYVGPAIFDDVPADGVLAQQEIFGPVLAIQRAATFDDAMDLFNRSAYALTGGIYSRSPAHIEQARADCECGNFYINRKITNSRVDLQPFGGYRLSGDGSKIGGPDYLVQFCVGRTVSENTLRRGFAPSRSAEAVR